MVFNMNDDFKLSVFSDPTRIPEIIELFDLGLGHTTQEHWMWRLFSKENPYESVLIIAEDKNNKIVGMSTVITALYGSDLLHRKCMQFGDWVVHPDHRGKGIISLLYNYSLELYKNKGFDFIIEFPNDNSYPIFQKYGFKQLENTVSYRTPYHFFFSRKIPHDFTYNNVNGLFTKQCPPDLKYNNNKNRIHRTYNFMHWKYDLNPDTDYNWLVLKEKGEFVGYFVYTLNKGRLNTALNIYDWEFTGKDLSLFRHTIKILSRYANYVEIWGKYHLETVDMFKASCLTTTVGAARLMLKSISDLGWDNDIILSRIDTDY